MTSSLKFRNSARWILLIGDLITLILFIIIGQRDHGTVNHIHPVLGVLSASWEFALVWLVVGWPLGAFPRVEEWTTRVLLTRPVTVWLAAAPLGLLLRSWTLHRLNIPTLFLAATLGFGLVFLLAWRLLFVWGWKTAVRRQNPT